MNKVILSFFLFLLLGFSDCKKIAKNTPKAIKKLTRENRNSTESVMEYKCNEKLIYCFESGQRAVLRLN